MAIGATLAACLTGSAVGGIDPELAGTVSALAAAAAGIGELVSLGLLAGDLSACGGRSNAAGDSQKALDVIANERLLEALRRCPVAFVASEEVEHPVVIERGAPLAVAIDPLDGSSNIDTNISIGTIFTIMSAQVSASAAPTDAFLRPGSQQLAAGFFVYGPQTSLVVSLGRGVQVFILNRAAGEFVLAADQVSIPRAAGEYAINASNHRHWDEPIRAYIDDCVQGVDGPHGRNCNMRWIASLVAEAYRILVRGGIFLYPADRRLGYRNGRLRLVYEANPIAFLMEQCLGAATDGVRRILDITPASLHQRTPLVFGSAEMVAQVARYHTDSYSFPERSPLFGRRGLLRV